MEFGQLFYVLRSRWHLLFLSVAIVVTAAIAYRLTFPGAYRAVASVVVDPRGINPVSGAATQQPLAQDSVLGTYANVARSEGLARQVFQKLPVATQESLKTQWARARSPSEPGFEPWAARRLMRDMDIRAGGQSSHVLDITFADGNRNEAALVANTYADELIRYARDMRSSAARQDADYFRTQALVLRQETEEAEQRLTDFQRENGITSGNDRADVEAARLAALNAQNVINQDLSYDSSSRAKQASSSSSEVVNNLLVQTLAGEVAKKEARLRELSSRLGMNHPDMITARAQLDEARASLDRESRNVTASLGTSSAVARARAAALRTDSEQQRKRVVEMNALRVELASLDKEVQQKRKLYESAQQRSAEAALEAGSQRADLQLLTEALPPDERAGPGARVLFPLAAIAGLLIGVFLAIFLDRLRPRVHRLADLEDMGVPVLHVVPVTDLGGNQFARRT